MPNNHCDAHEEFLVAVTRLSADVSAMRTIFKWTISTVLTLSLFIAGAVGTFVYKATDVYGQVQQHDVRISHLETGKG